MSSKTLGNLIKTTVVAMSICGLFVCSLVIPSIGKNIVETNPEFTSWYHPWLIFIWILAIPCFVIMVYLGKLSNAIILENVFTLQTAKWVKTEAMLLLSDVALLFIGNILLFVFNMNHPGVLLISIVADVFLITLSLYTATLSRYLTKATILIEKCEGI